MTELEFWDAVYLMCILRGDNPAKAEQVAADAVLRRREWQG